MFLLVLADLARLKQGIRGDRRNALMPITRCHLDLQGNGLQCHPSFFWWGTHTYVWPTNVHFGISRTHSHWLSWPVSCQNLTGPLEIWAMLSSLNKGSINSFYQCPRLGCKIWTIFLTAPAEDSKLNFPPLRCWMQTFSHQTALHCRDDLFPSAQKLFWELQCFTLSAIRIRRHLLALAICLGLCLPSNTCWTRAGWAFSFLT